MQEADNIQYKIIRGTTTAEFAPFLKQAAPMMKAWFDEAKSPDMGEFEVYAPTRPEDIIPGKPTFFDRLISGELVFVGVYNGQEVIGIGAGSMSEVLWCRARIAHMFMSYLKPEWRRRKMIAKRAGDVLAKFFLDAGAKFVLFDLVKSSKPFTQVTTEWRVRG